MARRFVPKVQPENNFGKGKLNEETPVFLGLFNKYDILYASNVRPGENKLALMAPFCPDKSYEASAHVIIDADWVGPELSSMSEDERSYFMNQIPDTVKSQDIYPRLDDIFPVYIPDEPIEIAARAPIFNIGDIKREDALDVSDVKPLREENGYLHMMIDADTLVEQSNKQRFRQVGHLIWEREGMSLTDAVCADYSYAESLHPEISREVSEEPLREKVAGVDVVDRTDEMEVVYE